MSMHRRNFLKHSLLSAAAATLPLQLSAQRRPAAPASSLGGEAFIVDTNVNIFCWPFRSLKFGETKQLVSKLKQHKVKQAWCGSFDSLLHKNIDSVNSRLAEECRANGGGVLIPFGTVNPAFPDWEEDLRRVHEVYRMPGIKLHPVYQGYTLDDPRFKQLLAGAAERGLLVQIAIDMEDERMQHPLVDVPAVDVTPLPDILRDIPRANVMLVNPFRHVRQDKLRAMVEQTRATFEFSNLDGIAGIERIFKGNHWYLSPNGLAMPEDRLTFGSHMPFFPLEAALFKLIESPLTRPQIQAVASANAERILRGA